MGGHHEHKLPPVPDWRIYKYENVFYLCRTQEKLAQLGLRDPWLRNEVWKYPVNKKYVRWDLLRNISFTGFKYGLIAAVITAGIEYAFFPMRKAPTYDDEHGHH